MRTIKTLYRNRLLTFMVLFLATLCYSHGTNTVEQHGRRIGPDGFLMEWNPENATTLEDGIWVWDAMNTPDGPSGYFSTGGQTVCPEWFFSFSPNSESTLIIQIPNGRDVDFFGMNMEGYEEQGSITFEWVIPWDQLDLDESGTYEITINAFSSCGDTLETVFLQGKTDPGVSLKVTPGMVIQAILIAILLVVYFLVRRWAKKQTDRRKSPHL